MSREVNINKAQALLCELITSEFRPGQSLGPLVAASGRAVTGPKASLAHRWCAAILRDRSVLGPRTVSIRDEVRRPAEAAALRDDAAERMLAAGVPEETVAAVFDPDRLASLLRGHPRFTPLVYWNRISDTFARYRFEDVNLDVVVVDGSNVAWNGGVRSREDKPCISNVSSVVSELSGTYGFFEVDVLFDANIRCDVVDPERIGELNCGVTYAPAGHPADSLILERARRRECPVVSNDVFRDYRRHIPGRVRRRRIGVQVRDGVPRFDAAIDEIAALRHRPVTS